MVTYVKKSRDDRVIEGVCGGLAEYFGVDSLFVRLGFVLLTLINGFGILLYIILVIIMPGEDKTCVTQKKTIKENAQEIGEKLKKAGEEFEEKVEKFGERMEETGKDAKPEHAKLLGAAFILVGLFFLLDQFRMFWWLKPDIMFSGFLILIGIWLLVSRSRSRK